MAAVTISNVRRMGQIPHIRGRAVLVKVTHTASYATGGEDLPIAQLRGLNTVDWVAVASGFTTVRVKGQAPTVMASGAQPKLAGTTAAPKLQLFVGAGTPAEVGNGTNVATITYDLLVVGR
jgi:hypothetical protein